MNIIVKKSFIILFLLCLFFAGCLSGTQNRKFSEEDIRTLNIDSSKRISIISNDVLKVDLNDVINQNNFASADLIDTMFFVPLQTIDESIMSTPYRMFISDDRIFVMDSKQNIMIFDLEGKFISSINKGNGPGEVSHIMTMTLADNQQLVVIQKTFFTYYNKNGKFTEKMERCPLNTSIFAITDWGYLFFQPTFENLHLNEHGRFSMLLANKDLSIFGTGITPVKSYDFLRSGEMIFRTDSSVLVSQFLNDTIFEVGIHQPVIKAKYILDYSDGKLKSEENISQSSGFCNSACPMENSTTQLFKFCSYERGECVVVRDKATGNMVGGTHELIDIQLCPSYLQNTMLVHNDYFVSWMEPFRGFNFKHPAISSADKEIASKFDDEDNVVLVFYKLKHF